jgi:tol-pal system protein YbgF
LVEVARLELSIFAINWPETFRLLTLSLDMKRDLCLGSVIVVALSLEAACLTAENSERNQLAGLEKGIESDRFAVDRSMPRVANEASRAETAAAAPTPTSLPPPRVAEILPSSAVDTGEGADMTPRTVIRIWGKNASSVEVVPASVPAKDGPGSSSPAVAPSSTGGEAQHAYDAALRLVNARAYDTAAGALGVFLLEWPGDPNASNAIYWQAECYYAMGEYEHSSELFEQAIERFPGSARHPDCLLKLGLCEEKLGDAAKAKRYFDRLGADYPRSEAARRIPKGT